MFHVCLNLYDLFQQSRGMTVQELERGFHGMSLDHGQVSGFKATTKTHIIVSDSSTCLVLNSVMHQSFVTTAPQPTRKGGG